MIYHASKFWEKLNKLNIHWLEKDGINNFKRSVNNNYFNWAVKTYSPYFLTLLRMSLKNMMKPGIFLNLLFINIPDMHYRTYSTEELKAAFFDRKIYAIYLFLLYKYALSVDKYDRDEYEQYSILRYHWCDNQNVFADNVTTMMRLTPLTIALGSMFLVCVLSCPFQEIILGE